MRFATLRGRPGRRPNCGSVVRWRLRQRCSETALGSDDPGAVSSLWGPIQPTQPLASTNVELEGFIRPTPSTSASDPMLASLAVDRAHIRACSCARKGAQIFHARGAHCGSPSSFQSRSRAGRRAPCGVGTGATPGERQYKATPRGLSTAYNNVEGASGAAYPIRFRCGRPMGHMVIGSTPTPSDSCIPSTTRRKL